MASSWKQQALVVLVGLPGAGKSTLAQKLGSYGWAVVNQDVLGNRKKCEAACKEALLAGRNVVIDRVNFNEQQRAVWVHLGRAVCGSALQLIVLQLVVPIETCKQRMREEARRAAGGGTPKDTDHLVDSFAADLTLADPWSEGFDQVYTISREDQVESFVSHVTGGGAGAAANGGGAFPPPDATPAAGRRSIDVAVRRSGSSEDGPPAAVPSQQQHQQQQQQHHHHHHQQQQKQAAAAARGAEQAGTSGAESPTAAAAVYFAGGPAVQAAAVPWAGGMPWAAGGAAIAAPYGMNAAMLPFGTMTMPGMGWVPMIPAMSMGGAVPTAMPAGAVMVPTAALAAQQLQQAAAAALQQHRTHQAQAAAAAASAAGALPPSAGAPGLDSAPRVRKAPPRRAISQLTPQDMPPWWRPKGGEDDPAGSGPSHAAHPYAVQGAAPPPPPPPAPAAPAAPQHSQPPLGPGAYLQPPPPRQRRPPGRSATFSGVPSSAMAPRHLGPWQMTPAGSSRASSGRPSPVASRRTSYDFTENCGSGRPSFDRPPLAPPPAGQQQWGASGGQHEGGEDGSGGGAGSGGGSAAGQHPSAAAVAADDEDLPPDSLASSRPGVFLDLLPATGPPILRAPANGAPAPPADPAADTRIILLFDLNGTLVSHASRRRSAGNSRLRPGLALLARLLPRFRLGLYTSSTGKTVCVLRSLLESAAGRPLFEPGLTLYRDHTRPAPMSHVRAGGKPWDTVKPLGHWFSRMHRVILLDDDGYKAVAGEEGNLMAVPAWLSESPGCDVLTHLISAIEEVLGPLGPEDDVRQHTSRLQGMLPPSPAPAPRGSGGGGPRPRPPPQLPPVSGADEVAAAAVAEDGETEAPDSGGHGSPGLHG